MLRAETLQHQLREEGEMKTIVDMIDELPARQRADAAIQALRNIQKEAEDGLAISTSAVEKFCEQAWKDHRP